MPEETIAPMTAYRAKRTAIRGGRKLPACGYAGRARSALVWRMKCGGTDKQETPCSDLLGSSRSPAELISTCAIPRQRRPLTAGNKATALDRVEATCVSGEMLFIAATFALTMLPTTYRCCRDDTALHHRDFVQQVEESRVFLIGRDCDARPVHGRRWDEDGRHRGRRSVRLKTAWIRKAEVATPAMCVRRGG